MTRLETIFARDRKALVAYLCVGDPSVDESVALARVCVAAGADVIELGVPFSDPTADGPAIARASQRAIARGGGFDATLRAARALRDAEPNVGIVLFGYYNPLLVRGEARAASDAMKAGVDALLVVDLPIEESAALREHAPVVPLLAPTSGVDRLDAVKRALPRVPFVYYVSVTGVTGSGAVDARDAGARAAELRANLKHPVVVGFGIDSREKARAAAAAGADGVVVGTAIVRAVEDSKSAVDRAARVGALVRELRAGVDEAPRS